MAVKLTAVLALGELALTAWEKYQEARVELADAADDSVTELDAKLDAVFARIAEKKRDADEALAAAANRS